jgi:hypothetical protein
MSRLFIGVVVCLLVGAGVTFTGLGRLLPLDRVTIAEVPASWAAIPSNGRVRVALVQSSDLLTTLATGLSGAEVALDRTGALVLTDGRVFAVSGASVRSALRALAWDRLPIEAHQASNAEVDRFTTPAPASIGWQARLHAYLGLRAARDFLAARPSFCITSVATALLLLLHAFATGISLRDPGKPQETAASPWRRRRAEPPVRVVLVADTTTLMHARTAIGEQYVVAETEYAFAFADGWILAARKGSVFELMDEVGWRMRPIEMAMRSELVGEGRPLNPLASHGPSDTLELIEALHVCGPLAYGTGPDLSAEALSA